MGCIYRHIRLDKNEVFYIGISKNLNRPYDKVKRSRHWKSIVSKAPFEVEIILESDDIVFLKNKEIEFIKIYGRKDKNQGSLVNMTDGGDGGNGCVHTEEFKKKVSEMNKKRTGQNNPNYKKQWDQTYKDKIRIANTGKKFTAEHCLKISISKTNPNKKPKTLKGISKGENHYLYGKSNERLKIIAKNQVGDKSPRSKKIIDTKTKIIYSCIREASEKTGINYSTLRSNLNRNKKNQTTFIYI